MQTRVVKKRANAPTVVEIQQLKKQRVVLGELPGLPNLIAPPTLIHHNNPKLNKPPPTNKPNSLSLAESAVNNDVDAKPGKHVKFHDPHVSEPYVSDIHCYLRSMEVTPFVSMWLSFLLILLMAFCGVSQFLHCLFLRLRKREDQWLTTSRKFRKMLPLT